MTAGRLGWILVHKVGEAGPKSFESEDDLESELNGSSKNDLWFWNRSRPMRPNGLFTLLFAFNQSVWADAEVGITQEVPKSWRKKGFNFAFVFNGTPSLLRKRGAKEIPLGKIVLDNRAKQHRDLIKLDPDILRRYHRYARSARTTLHDEF